jgi:transcriptional regulator with XRE-family HTH domain
METFGENLKAARERAGLKQKDVAAKIECASTSFTNWENNLIQPAFETVEKICEVLGISPLELLDREYTYNDIVTISEKPVRERSYMEKLALNFTRFSLEEQIQAERDNADYIEQRTGLSAAAVAALTGKHTLDYAFGDDDRTGKATPAALAALNRLLSSPDGIQALENIAYYLQGGNLRFADGVKNMRVETGLFTDIGRNSNNAAYFTADMTKAIFRDMALRCLDKLVAPVDKEELDAARAEFRADMSKRNKQGG